MAQLRGKVTPTQRSTACCEQIRSGIRREAPERAARRKLLEMVSTPVASLEPDEAVFTSNQMVLVRRMPRDGNSLFAAMSHLVEGVAPGSSAHRHFATSMRHQAAFYMNRNWQLFFKPLLRSLCVHGESHKLAGTDEERVRRHIGYLATPGFAAGPEVVPAVAFVYDVDVMVYPEGGAAYLVSTAPQPLRQVAIAYRLAWEGEGQLKDYFDVVVSVHPARPTITHRLHVAPQ